VVIQKIREAERSSVLDEFGKRGKEIVTGIVQRIERGTIFVDLGRAIGIIGHDDQVPGERFRQGERIRSYLYLVEETPSGVILRLSRSHPDFIRALFAMEAPEVASGVVELKSIAREAGSRTKIAVASSDPHVDPVGSCVGQRGVRVATVISELGGEKIDVVEWEPDPAKFIADALSPAKVQKVDINEEEKRATVDVLPEQLSLAIGRGGQNARLAVKLTGYRIDIRSSEPVATEEAGEAEGGEIVGDEMGTETEHMESSTGGTAEDEIKAADKEANEE
jgi:N utilization substance protein A